MDVVLALVVDAPEAIALGALAAGVGAAVGALVAARLRSRRVEPVPPEVPPIALDLDLSRRSVEALSTALVVLSSSDEVVLANPAARRLGVVRDGRVPLTALRAVVREARRSGELADVELELPRGRGLEPLGVRVQAAPLGPTGHVALQVDDVTEAHRVAKVRRDFVANVSHELKTPVGALAILAEAILDATDDPEAVRRFAQRMQHESTRLGRLVQELIDLSRLQGADPLPEPKTVFVDTVVAEVVDRSRLAADTHGITLVSGGEHGLTVQGSESQLITALANLVDNAIAYSPQRTRVAIGTRRRDGLVEVSVSDQGIGIGEGDLDRIFERFYRADPARSRATGGTGLGLAIVKHIATNHGGSVDVWSVEGSGSTFTLRLPGEPDGSAAAASAGEAVSGGSGSGPGGSGSGGSGDGRVAGGVALDGAVSGGSGSGPGGSGSGPGGSGDRRVAGEPGSTSARNTATGAVSATDDQRGVAGSSSTPATRGRA